MRAWPVAKALRLGLVRGKRHRYVRGPGIGPALQARLREKCPMTTPATVTVRGVTVAS